LVGKLSAVSDILEYLKQLLEADVVDLDQWQVVLRPHEMLEEGHKLRTCGSHPQPVKDLALQQQLIKDLEMALPVSRGRDGYQEVFMGFWQNYFSMGIDAKVTNFVDLARNKTKCGQCCFRHGGGKLCYAWQGMLNAFRCELLPNLLRQIRVTCWDSSADQLEDLEPPLSSRTVNGGKGRVRQMMLVNINSYAAGQQVQPKACVASTPPNPGDGQIEIMGVRSAVAGLAMMGGLMSPTYLTSTKCMTFSIASGMYMQLDGEPWKLNCGCDVMVELHRKVSMLRAPANSRYWHGHIQQGFWSKTESKSSSPLLKC